RDWWPRHGRCSTYEYGRPYADQLSQYTAPCQPDQRRRASLRHRDPGVGQDQPDDLIKVALRPAERNWSAPVMCHQHYSTGDSQLRADGGEVIDPSRKRTRPPRSLGVTHPKLVDRDNAPARIRRCQEPSPQIGPSRVAVQAEQRSHLWHYAVVEHVPGAQHAFRIDGVDQP